MTLDSFTPLTIEDYAAQAALTDQRSDGGSLAFPLLGLFGETGSLLSEVKKKQRDRTSYRGYAGAVVEELGDVLWYLAAVASRTGVTLPQIFAEADFKSDAGSPLTLAALQPDIMPRGAHPTAAFERTLLKLAGEVGSLVMEAQGQIAGDGIDRHRHRLAAITRSLIQAANEAASRRKARKRKRLQAKGTLTAEEGVRLTTLKEFAVRSDGKKAKKSARAEGSELTQRRCGSCGEAGHNARTCR